VAPSTITRWSLLRSRVLIIIELRNLPPHHVHSVNYAKHVQLSRALSSSITNSLQKTVLVQACNSQSSLIFFLLLVEEFYGTRYQSGAFSLIIVGSGCRSLRSLFFLMTSIHSFVVAQHYTSRQIGELILEDTSAF
jgi:hypothetical protein